MKRTLKITSIIIFALVVISNTPPVQFFVLDRYTYRNLDDSFRFEEEPGSLYFKTCLSQFETFKREHPHNPNKTLYRSFTIKPWQFWEWWQYIAHPKRFTLPYLEPTD
ncbi:hypothetical protein EZ428_18560 [Pedobacter frigiditerrae]|uniref:Uncharacterized protein n=1 Tax=Pedobacter frigiditerrae TaxID=2530452 RepID=A0A4R0MPB6_9SPHI|nr:hypothetical protein [Pedobacter frigiditerrae]TCC88640.1 hypothetical protein EZ428_18560 [Pedobacter frigiditerrae]